MFIRPTLGIVGLLLSVLVGKPQAAPISYLQDEAGVLSSAEHRGIEELLAAVDAQGSLQIGIDIVKAAPGGDIEGFSMQRFKQWGIGQRRKDNGALIILALDDHAVRIETGYGLEAVLTDGRCGSIIDTYMAPRFKQGGYAEGLAQGVKAIVATFAIDMGPSFIARPGAQKPCVRLTWFHLILLAIMVVIFIKNPSLFLFLLMSAPRGGFGGGFGSGFGGFGGGGSGGGGASRGW